MVSKLVLGGVLLIILSVGFVFMNWDSSEEDSEISLTTKEKILEKFGNVGYEKGYFLNGEKIVTYKGDLETFVNG